MPYTTVLFDLDHTLLDSDASERMAYEMVLREAGVDQPDRWFPLYRSINLSMWAEVEAGTIRPDDVRIRRFERFCEEAGIDADPGAMAEHYVEGLGSFGQLYPGAAEMLSTVGAGARLGLVTNGISDVQRARIARLGIDAIFSVVVVSSEVGVAKPAPGIFDIVFELLGDPSRDSVLMVGDSLSSDMAGAIGYGIGSCWYNPRREAPAAGFDLDHVVHDLGDIADVVSH